MEPHLPSRSGTPFLKTIFNGVNTLSGVGILSIPYALAQGGWLSLGLLILVATMFGYTGILLKRCMDSNSTLVKTYPDIGELAFGSRGRIIVSFFLYLELYLVAIEFLILEGDNLEKLFPTTNFHIKKLHIKEKQGFVLIAALIVLPTTWLRSLKLLAYLSFGGVMSSVILTGCVLWAGAVDGVGFHQKGQLINWEGVPSALSLFAFSYCGHAVFPTIYTSMVDKTRFSQVLFICFAICTLNIGAMATMGYLMYGKDLNAQVTLNLPVGKLSSKLAIYTTIITPLTKYAFLVTPITISIEEWFQITKLSLVSIAIRTTLVVSTVVVALTVPYFGYVVELTGAFLCSTSAMLLPCICYLKIFKTRRDCGVEFFVTLAIMVMGAFVAVVGTYRSLDQIIKKF